MTTTAKLDLANVGQPVMPPLGRSGTQAAPQTRAAQQPRPQPTQQKQAPAPQQGQPRDGQQQSLGRVLQGIEGRLRQEIQQSAQSQSRALANQQQILSARMQSLEDEVNSLEGHLRIDLLPQYRAILEETLEDRRFRNRGRGVGVAALVLAGLGGVILGVLFAADLYFYGLRALTAMGLA